MIHLRTHISQIIIHLLFWMLFIFASLFVFSSHSWKENPFIEYLFILVFIVYGNTQFLLPFFVKKKWYILYIFVFAIISIIATQLYCNVFAQCGCSLLKCLSDYLWQTLVPLIFFSFVWMLYRYLDQEEQVIQMKKAHQEMELKFLKSQIDPHVLFNNLNTIYSYSINKPKDTPKLILMLSQHLKHVLYESNAEKIPLEKEIQFIDNYIQFQAIRTEGVKTVDYKKNINKNKYQIAPLLLVTLFENAFKHSIPYKTITIRITVDNDILLCRCTNYYNTDKAQNITNNIGLINLKKRLDLLYKDKYDLQIIKDPVYTVTLKLHLL